MKFNRDWIQDHIEETLPSDQEIVDVLNMKSSEVEGSEKVGNFTIFDVKVLPDRAHYMLSHYGMAYDLSACLGLHVRELTKFPYSKKSTDKIAVKIDEMRYCKRYSATYISNIKNGDSPEWLRSRLQSIGQRSINLIVDLTNYVMFDTGQPLHAFDAKKVKGVITIRRANVGEKLETLDGKNITLNTNHVIIADEVGPLALAGIKGGKRAEVDSDTTEIILESANFNPVSVRKTSFEVQIRNESSKRFENEITPQLVERGRDKFLEMIKKEIPNVDFVGTNDVGLKTVEMRKIILTNEKIRRIIGSDLSAETITSILKMLKCEVSMVKSNYEVIVPHERLDLDIEEDLVDEIARLYGLNNIDSKLPVINNHVRHSEGYIITDLASKIFWSENFSEIITRSFTSNGEIETLYPVASDKAFLRKDLATNLERSLDMNILNAPLLGQDTIRIFEIGKVFTNKGEYQNICFAIAFTKKVKGGEQKLRDIVSDLSAKLSEVFTFREPYIICSGNKIICELADIVLKNGANSRINLEDQPLGSTSTFKAYSNEPFIVRDIAIFVPSTFKIDDIRSEIESSIRSKAGNLLIKGPDLFDTFSKGDQTSYAFRMIFQAFDRTLSDDEANSFMDIAYSRAKELGWVVR
jgi:phenylalanyl-tRNA synthetase beta chain